MGSKVKTYLILFLGVFALSTSAIFVKLSAAPSAVTAFYRLLFAGCMLLPFFLLRRESRAEAIAIRPKQWGQIICAGLFLALHYVLWFESLQYTSTASSTVIVCLQPLFSLALERFISKKRIKSSALIGCAVALVGCFVIGAGDFQISGRALIGDIMAFAAAGIISYYYFVGESVRKEISAITYSTLAYLVSALILLVYILIRRDPLSGFPAQTWKAFFGIALVSTIGGQFVFNLLLKKLPASAVTMGILGEPIGTCILAYFILKESMAADQLLGFAVIIIGMAIFFMPEKKKSA